MDPEAPKVIEMGYGGSERLTMNMGPQHPSTHGVFRAILTLAGETVVGVDAVIGGATVFLYWFREREWVLDLFEALRGARLRYGLHQVGGTRYDIPPGWDRKVRDTIGLVERRLDEYEDMLEGNAFFQARTQGVGVVSRELAQAVGISGPLIRGSGVNYDIRRAEPYSSYEDFDFKVPIETAGDCYARYRVRMVEFRESIKIVRQALDGLPAGPISSRPGV